MQARLPATRTTFVQGEKKKMKETEKKMFERKNHFGSIHSLLGSYLENPRL